MCITERELIKQIITVHRKKFATGLFWQPVSVGNTALNYAKQLSKNIDKKYTLFVDYKSMVGLGDKNTGVYVGLPSAAAEIVDSLSEFVSFLGVFQVNNYFYLVAVRNGVIIRDVLIETAEQARKLYTELSNIPDWGGLFAPASWGMPKAQEKFISELIRPSVSARLHPINVFNSIWPTIIFFVLVLLVGGVLFRDKIRRVFFSSSPVQTNPELVAEYKRNIELKKQELAKQLDIAKQEVTPIEFPYDYLPNVMERAKLCYKAIAFVMQPIPGWNQTYAKCGEDFVSVTFARNFGTINEFYLNGAELMPGAMVQQLSENEVMVRVRLPQLKTYASLDERDIASAVRDITTNFQQINIRADINPVTDTVTNGVDTESVNIVEISAASKLIPTEFMHIFNDFDGVYMTSVAWNAVTRMWQYEVIIYTK